MPELYDLDHVFDDLTAHVGAHTHAPGADRVASAARSRRRGRIGIGGGALALLVGGGLALGPLRPSAPDVRYADGLPPAAALSPEVLDRVTAGWVAGWVVPTAESQITDETGQALDACGNSMLGGDDTEAPVSTGAAIFVAGRSMAFARGSRSSSDAVAQHVMSKVTAGAGCHDVRTTWPATDTEVITASASGAAGSGFFAIVRWHDRVAYAGLAAPDQNPQAGVQDALGDALLAAVQDDAIVSTEPAILQDTMGGSQSGSATSADTPTYSMNSPTAADLQQAFGSWAPGYSAQAAADMINAPDCLQDSAASSFGESVGSAATASLSTYDTTDGSQRALADDQSSLAGCGFTTEGPAGDFLVASKGGAHPVTLWFLHSGIHVVWLQLDGSADPPPAVTDSVRTLLTTAVGTITEQRSSSTEAPSAHVAG